MRKIFYYMKGSYCMTKIALITWVTWQDGSYLAEFLLQKWYEVHGLKRRSSSLNSSRIDHIYEAPHLQGRKFIMHYCDMTDTSAIMSIMSKVQPDEVYNLAAQSHVKVSFEKPEYTADTDAIWPLRILEAIMTLNLKDKTKFYQASTSEMYWGIAANMPIAWYTEKSPFHPRSPYWVAKLYGHWITINYRESYWVYACSWILFNHESPRRWETFVTRKITRAIAQIYLWLIDSFQIWNLDAYRDRWHAKDYVEAMWLMLQQDSPEDFVIATGKTQSVRDFIEICMKEIEIEIERRWSGVDEKWYNKATGALLVEVSDKYFRPAEVELLLGDATYAKTKLWWVPKYTMDEMVKEMLNNDITFYKQHKFLLDNGYKVLDFIDM